MSALPGSAHTQQRQIRFAYRPQAQYQPFEGAISGAKLHRQALPAPNTLHSVDHGEKIERVKIGGYLGCAQSHSTPKVMKACGEQPVEYLQATRSHNPATL